MFGHNPLRKKELTDGSKLWLQGEPWFTIQGEGPHAGLPATFIRLWGCMLACTFCDTDFESDKRTYGIQELAALCNDYTKRLVVLTGGDPMRQNIAPLCDLLHSQGHLVQIETAGTFTFQQVLRGPLPDIVVSPKTNKVHPNITVSACAWKYIISCTQELAEDGLPVTNTQSATGKRLPLARPLPTVAASAIYVQPMDEQHPIKNQANMALCVELAKRHGYRVSLQQHKILGVL